MSIVEREQVFSGRYRVVGTLGDGGMARVYKAVDARLGRAVAVKMLHPYYNNQSAFVARFEQEARLAAGLNHPNIMGVYDIGRDDDGSHYIVMEYVEGETLKRLIEREAPLPLPAAAAILRQIGVALDYAHAHGVIHRDVKPENIFLTPERAVKVGDFGIARALDANTLTPAGMVLGSVSYLAPEQALGQRTTAQSDLYSTGAVLYEMLTGRLPFVAENALGVAMMHINEDAPPPSRLTPGLLPAVDAVVLTAMAKDPARRYHTGAALADALDHAEKAGATTTITPAVPPAPAAAAPIPAPTPALTPPTRLLDLRPVYPVKPVEIRPAPATPIVDLNAASTSHRLDDGTWAPLAAAGSRAPQGRASAVAPVAAPMRAKAVPAARGRRALIPLVVPLLAILAVAGVIKATTGGHGERYGAGYAAAPTATTTRTATPRYAVLGARHAMQHRRRSSAKPRRAAGAVGAVAVARGRHHAASTATPTVESASGVGAPVGPIVIQPTEAAPTATDAPSYTYTPVAPVAPVRRARPRARVAPTWTPAPTATYNAPTATDTVAPRPTDTPRPRPSDTPAPRPTDTMVPQPSNTPDVSSQGTGGTATVAPPTDVSTPVDRTGAAAPTSVPTSPPPADTPVAATAVPAQSGNQGAPASFNLDNVAVSAQALDAVYYANDVYMQVMQNRDTSNVDSAFSPALANTNRGVAANLAANHQHWNITLVGISLSNEQIIDANTVRVTVTKTERPELLSDSGQVIKPAYTDTETFVDIVQRINGRWIETNVYH